MLGVPQAKVRPDSASSSLKEKLETDLAPMTFETDPTDSTGDDDPQASLDLWDDRLRVHESYWSAREVGSGEETWLGLA